MTESDTVASDWLEKAEADLHTATILVDAEDIDAALFHMHQAIEKGLKALQIHRHGEHELSHDLVRLADDMAFNDQRLRLMGRLNPVYTGFRYPDEDTPEIANIDDLLDEVTEVIEWIRTQLPGQKK